MMRRLARLAWPALMLAAVPTLLPAQSASVDARNTAAECAPVDGNPLGDNVPGTAGANKKMGLHIKVTLGDITLPNVNVSNIDLAPCDDGNLVARKVMDAMLADLTGPGGAYTCLEGGLPTCGGAVAAGEGPLQDWDFTAKGRPCGFKLRKAATAAITDVDLEADPTGSCIPTAENITTNAGNDVGPDLLPRYLVQVDPSGVNGPVTFNVFPPGSQTPTSFTVDTSAFPDETALANEISSRYNGLGLGLTTRVHPKPNHANTHFPEVFVASCPIVEITNAAQKAREFTVKGLPGQYIVQETSADPKAVPALSPWGVALLIAVLLTTSVWMLRRRVRMSETQTS